MHKYQSAEIGELNRAHTPTPTHPGQIRFEFSRRREQPEEKTLTTQPELKAKIRRKLNRFEIMNTNIC